MSSLYKLVTKTNLKSPTLAFPLVMPLVFILLYSVGIDIGLGQEAVDMAVAGFFVTIISITTMQNGLMGFGINFISIKKSVLLKRIGATELSKMDVIIALLLYGLTLWVISMVWITLAIIVFSAMGVFYSAEGAVAGATAWMQYVNWAKIALSTLVMLVPSYALGLFFTSVAKDDQAYMGMAMLYFFFAGFVGGIMFPPTALVPHWMQWVGYLVPHSYIGNFYDWSAGYSIGIWGLGESATLAVSAIIPLTFGVAITFAAAKTLKFD